MTPKDFAARANDAAAASAAGEPQFGPIAILVITSAIAAAVSWLVEHCLDRLMHKDATAPNLLQRARLRIGFVGPAVRDAIAANPDAFALDPWAIENSVMQGLLSAGKSLTASEFAALKAQGQHA